jgi:putative RNA 2'-phosphotransferase
MYELEPNDQGWVSVEQLIERLGREPEFVGVELSDLERMIARADKKRHEIRDARIRALYGHSLPIKPHKVPAMPPVRLFHGTIRQVLAGIVREGLKPMRRQYVHLSPDVATARQVALRKGQDIVILGIAALDAANAGVAFYEANDQVWLADEIPPKWIEFPPV